MSETELVRILQMSDSENSESFKTRKCHNLKMRESFKTGNYVKNLQNRKISESFKTGTCHNLNLSDWKMLVKV